MKKKVFSLMMIMALFAPWLTNVRAQAPDCSPITVTASTPWTENFENFYYTEGMNNYSQAINDPKAKRMDQGCWDVYPPCSSTAQNTHVALYTDYRPASSSGMVSVQFFNRYNGNGTILILPEFSNPLSNLEFSFFACRPNSNIGILQVGYWNGGVFTALYDNVPVTNGRGVTDPPAAHTNATGPLCGPFTFVGAPAGARIAMRYYYPNATSTTSSCINLDDFSVRYVAPVNPGTIDNGPIHVAYMTEENEEIIDSLNLGVRPKNAWTEPFQFRMYSEGPTYTVTVLDFTPSDGMFTVEGEELPFVLVPAQDVDLTMSVNAQQTGVIERQFVAITEGDRAAHVWPVVVEVYDPAIPDVVEKAYDLGVINPGFSYTGVPSEITPTELHDDYNMPFTGEPYNIPDGVDAVYKLTVNHDVILNAYVDTLAENGKVALYTEDFYGEGGPMAHNYYQGLNVEEGEAAQPYEAMIGDAASTSTSTYFPFHSLWNYSLAENLYLASELNEAGVTTAPMTSLSFYVSSTTCTTPQNNINIWMANVSDAALTNTSHTTAGMTLVYSGGNVLPVANQWNEFVFNQNSFAWDGHSNILVVCQRQNGSYQGSINWRTHNPGFVGMSYAYTDYAPGYDATTQTYSMTTSTTNRANVILKSNGGRNRDVVTIDAGNTSINNRPFNTRFNQGLSQQIYTAAEIGRSGYITSISFRADRNYHQHYNAAVYLRTVSMTSFTNSSLVPMSNADLVYQGVFETNGIGWQTIVLDTPYYYDGTGSLMVTCNGTVLDPQSENDGWTVHNTSANMSYYKENLTGTVPYDVTNPGTTDWTFTNRNNIKIEFGAAPVPPTPQPAVDVNISAGPVIENLPLTPGVYYLVASATQPDYTVYINANQMPCPAVEGFAWGETPADDEDGIEPGSVTLRWNIPAYATGWRLVFGSTYHPQPGHPQTIMYPADGSFTREMANSYTVTNLWNNTNYFWHVEFNNDGCPEGLSSPIWGFTTHFNIPQNLTAEDYTVFNDEQVVLHWNAVVDRTFRTYWVYRDGVKIGQTTINNIGDATYTDGPLPYNMGGYVYYVTAIYDEGESAPSDPITVKVSGYGDVNGHVYEMDGTTGIAGATVTMVGTDEFGDAQTYHFVTNGEGYYSGHIYAGEYNGSASCDGYQTIDAPVQGNPINMVYNQTTSPIDYILDENFDPVCSVLAEYYPDIEDPNSPYVKVSWGCGLPGEEIIEDFETGDFSKFEWQLDGSYPWSVVTTNPYEGEYCMKSGGAGVNSVTSNMTVTVEIPNDGLMSFFGKISCESSWDYGYFYIDGVQKGSYTGESAWGEKVFEITAGEHTFMWQYTKDGSVNSGEDCFYVDYINFYKQPEPAVPGMTYTFEDGTLQGWTTIDADGDGYNWMLGSDILSGDGLGHNGSNGLVLSQSYDNNFGVLYPDNYLVSPQVELGGIVKFYACAQDAGYAAEHFGVAVSTTNTQPSSFTMVQEWTLSAKGVGEPNGKPVKGSRSGRVQGNWYEYTVDLSAYSGMGYVALRHFNCSDMFYIDVDDITIGEPGAKGVAQTRTLDHYRIYRTNCYNDGPYTEDNTVLLATNWPGDTVYMDVEWADLPAGVYKWGVGCVYAGNRGELTEGEISWTEPVAIDNNNTLDQSAPGGEPIQLPRESEIIWSNCLDKDMYLEANDVTVNVLLNSADSPEGVNVTFTNYNAGEQANYGGYNLVLDETGFYAFESFRKGEYMVEVTFDGYEPIYDSVSIWEPTDLRYVMTEIIYNVHHLYVSSTGWAMWQSGFDQPLPAGRHLEGFKVMCESLDHEPIFNADVPADRPFCQVNTDELVAGEHYLCKVAAIYSTGLSAWVETEWQYIPCENYAGTVDGVTIEGNTISWTYPGVGPVPPVPPVPGQNATITLTVGDVWGDGSGYQMLLDADANAYGTTIPETGALSLNCSGNEAIYAEFEYKIPSNADGSCTTQNIVLNNSISIEVPAGTYDWCITNPTPNDRIWIASAQGNVGGRQNDYVFEAGKTYEFTVTMQGSNDAVNVVISGGAKNAKAPLAAGEVKDMANVTPGNYGYIVRPVDNGRAGQWYNYDNGNNMDAIGLSQGTANFSWGIVFPAGSFNSGNLTKVGYYDYTAHTGNIHIYQGGTGNSTPGAEVYTQAYTVSGTETYIDINLNNAVAVDATQALWVVMESTTPGWTASIDDSGSTNPNGALVSTDGVSFSPIDVASGGSIVGNWNLRAYIEDGAPVPPIPAEGNVLGAMVFINGEWEAFVPYPTNTYEFGNVGEYCVRMVYDGSHTLPEGNIYYSMSCPECASNGPGATEIEENGAEVALFPNPTKGNVTIQAAGMNHITVVSVLGQVVYDADVTADELTLSMAQFNAGLYTVRISTSEGVAVRRLTVVR